METLEKGYPMESKSFSVRNVLCTYIRFLCMGMALSCFFSQVGAYHVLFCTLVSFSYVILETFQNRMWRSAPFPMLHGISGMDLTIHYQYTFKVFLAFDVIYLL